MRLSYTVFGKDHSAVETAAIRVAREFFGDHSSDHVITFAVGDVVPNARTNNEIALWAASVTAWLDPKGVSSVE